MYNDFFAFNLKNKYTEHWKFNSYPPIEGNPRQRHTLMVYIMVIPFIFPWQFCPSCPASRPADPLSRDVTWRRSDDTRDLTRARSELHFLVTETLHCGSLAPYTGGREQRIAGGAKLLCDHRHTGTGWLQAVAAMARCWTVRSHNPIIWSQSNIMSPDTSTLLTLAWLVSGQSQYVVKSQILMYLFRFSWSLSLSVITSVKRQTETKLELLGPEGNIGLKLSR